MLSASFVKNSMFEALIGAPSRRQSPSPSWQKMRSMSDEKFSSPPPNLPRASAQKRAGLFANSSQGVPNLSVKRRNAIRWHSPRQNSASRLSSPTVVLSSANPLTLR